MHTVFIRGIPVKVKVKHFEPPNIVTWIPETEHPLLAILLQESEECSEIIHDQLVKILNNGEGR